MIYLDNAATTKIDDRVLDAMEPYLTENYGNAGTLYGLGRESAEAIKKARACVADLIGAKPEQIVFTSGGTESNNMVLRGVLNRLEREGKPRILTTRVEHDSVLRTVENICGGNRGFYASFASPTEGGWIDPQEFVRQIDENTGFASVMTMNNETGVRNDVWKIAEGCKRKGVLFHTDCVQAIGCEKIDVNTLLCDFLSVSSHKIHGPKGVGALYVRDLSTISPMITGGKFQEFGMRGGTENVAGIVGFGKACELLENMDLKFNSFEPYKKLFMNRLKTCLSKNNLEGIVHINGDSENSGSKILNVRFDNVDAETLLLMLDSNGVCVSAGSACASHEHEPSHVLLAMGLRGEDAMNSIRISMSRMNDGMEIYRAAEIMASCVCKLSSL